MKHRYKSCYDFDSDYDYYEYLSESDSDSEDEYREPDEPEECYRETDDRNYPSNDVRWLEL